MTTMISKSIILMIIAVIVVGGAGAAVYVALNDGARGTMTPSRTLF